MKAYRRVSLVYAEPYVPGQSLENVSIPLNTTPMKGGYIIRDSDINKYVTKEHFEKHYKEVLNLGEYE